MDEQRIDLLSRKIADGSVTDVELREYNDWFSNYDHMDYSMKSDVTKTELKKRIYTNIANEANFQIINTKSVKLWPRILTVAAAVAFIIVGIQFFRVSHKPANPTSTYADIKPGKNGATITMASGKVIQLSDNKTGVVIGKDLKYNDGTTDPTLSQSDISSASGENSIMLTASTAKGQTYQFTLPDGTEVWLNADSKISFPSQFSGKNRNVVMSGEGYFQVAKDKTHPFIVKTTRQKVEVLGTHFNISSYSDEIDTKTALEEGSVKINNQRIIKPGEQASSTGTGDIKVTDVDVEKVTAWKNGRFVFENESIESIMRKLSRWYNVDVIYQDDVKDLPFTAFISRRDNISKILDKITYTQNIHFKIEGRTIIVMK